MKAKYMFEVMDMDDCQVAVPVNGSADLFHGVLKLNETGVAILKLLENETNEDNIVADLLKKYEGDPEKIREYVREFLETLKAEGLVQ